MTIEQQLKNFIDSLAGTNDRKLYEGLAFLARKMDAREITPRNHVTEMDIGDNRDGVVRVTLKTDTGVFEYELPVDMVNRLYIATHELEEKNNFAMAVDKASGISLAPRAISVLKNNDIDTFDKLTEYTESDFKQLPAVGKLTLDQVKAFLAANGRGFKE